MKCSFNIALVQAEIDGPPNSVPQKARTRAMLCSLHLIQTKVIFQSGVNKHKNQLTLDFMDQIWPCVHTKSGTFPSF